MYFSLECIFLYLRSLALWVYTSEKHDRGKMHRAWDIRIRLHIYEYIVYIYRVYIKGVRERIVMCTVYAFGVGADSALIWNYCTLLVVWQHVVSDNAYTVIVIVRPGFTVGLCIFVVYVSLNDGSPGNISLLLLKLSVIDVDVAAPNRTFN